MQSDVVVVAPNLISQSIRDAVNKLLPPQPQNKQTKPKSEKIDL